MRFQLGNIAIDDEVRLRRQDGIARELGLAVDRNDPRTEGLLRRDDGIARRLRSARRSRAAKAVSGPSGSGNCSPRKAEGSTAAAA